MSSPIPGTRSSVHLRCSLLLAVLLPCLASIASAGHGPEGFATLRRTGAPGDPGARAMTDSAYRYADVDPAKCLAYALNAIDRARRSSDLSALHDALNAKRYVHYLRGEHELVLQTSMEALRVAQELADERSMGDDHGWISVALTELRQPEKAYQHAQRSMDHMRASNDRTALARGLCDMSEACVNMEKHAEALVLVAEASKLYDALDDSTGTAHAQRLMANILMDQHRWSDALPVLLTAYRYIDRKGEELDRCAAERDLAITYAGMQRWSDAEHFLITAEERAHRLKAVREYPALLKVRMELYEARHEPAQALDQARKLIELNDSLLRSDVAGRIASMNAVRDADQLQEELGQLRTENSALQDLVAKERLQDRWWIGAFVFLLAISLVAVRQMRFNRRASTLLREKNQRIRELQEQAHGHHLDLERQRMRLAETLLIEEQKDVLLKEIHHRVKNNLQVVNTLLKMQALHLNDPKLEDIFDEAQGRVRSMGLVHEHIYKVGDLSRVNVKAHVLALAEGILVNHGLERSVKLDLQVTYDKASVETLIPLSLLLNELLTNAAKHAFLGREQGTIRIMLRRLPDGQGELQFSDDGHGLHQDQLYAGSTFGMELVRTLAEQLNGSIRLLKGEGTTFELTFRPEERTLRAAS